VFATGKRSREKYKKTVQPCLHITDKILKRTAHIKITILTYYYSSSIVVPSIGFFKRQYFYLCQRQRRLPLAVSSSIDDGSLFKNFESVFFDTPGTYISSLFAFIQLSYYVCTVLNGYGCVQLQTLYKLLYQLLHIFCKVVNIFL